MFLPFDLVWTRVENARADSPISVCRNLMVFGEALLKTVAAGLIAGVADDKDRQRYRLCHKLIRANGLGEWSEVLGALTSGPALQHLHPGAAEAQQELTSRPSRNSELYEATVLLQRCLERVIPEAEKLPSHFDGRTWFSKFVTLRNKERAHGATPDDVLRDIAADLEKSVRLMTSLAITRRPWAFVRRNLSGKYNIVPLSSPTAVTSAFKIDRTISIPDGVYVDFGSPCRVELMDSTAEAADFMYPNGGFRMIKSEWISYISGTRKTVDAADYALPASTLPPSETEGHASLRVVGGSLANLPPKPKDYVNRDELEGELTSVLMNDRHPLVTLVGRGGIGKTSLALQVLHRLSDASDTRDRYLLMVWLSARDIDLLPQGPKVVRPSVISVQDIAKQIVSLLAGC